jgi:predicted glycogen debranching enzyme
MNDLVINTRSLSIGPVTSPESLLTREWLETNGLGGYASGTVPGVRTRRYHGLLIAALPAPLGRTMMLNHLIEEVRLPTGKCVQFGGEERAGSLDLSGAGYLTQFRLETAIPVWRYELDGAVLEKRVFLPHLQNTVHISYRLLSGPESVRLRLRPSMNFRSIATNVSQPLGKPYTVLAVGNRYEVLGNSHYPSLRLSFHAQHCALVHDGGQMREIFFREEHSRGYEPLGTLWSPGYFRADLAVGEEVTLTASTENWETIEALSPQDALAAEVERMQRLVSIAHPKAQQPPAADLVLAADRFIITPGTRQADATRAHAAGDEARSVIAGYHWFTDWGRDTMISLEGLTLTTGRHVEAGYILRTFGHYVRDGLIPNLFPEGEQEGLYHTADATLWFFHAIDRYLDHTGDRATLRLLLPTLIDIVEHHLRGTRFGIGVDPKDDLLRQGEEGYQLTWMDAKVGDWVVTPRRGKAVELNALWYNALRLMARWVGEERGEEAARSFAEYAERARDSFNRRFWYEQGGYLYDVIDGEQGDDPSFRPNQVFSVSLPHPVLDRSRWASVVKAVHDRLLTPVGLRSLAPGHPDYKDTYYGDLRSRDAAYHQGTVWAWLIGPFVDAWLKVHPEDRAGARRLLDGLSEHLGDACVGSISEIFDAEPPFTPRGCVAQAWSVAEVLRCWVKTAGSAG